MHGRDINKGQQLDCGGRKRGFGIEKQEEQECLWQRKWKKSRRRKLENGKAKRRATRKKKLHQHEQSE